VKGKSLLLETAVHLFEQTPVFIWAISYYIVLFFVNSNLNFLIVTVAFFLILYIVLKDLRQATFFMFIASLPFANGKTFEWLLVPRESVPKFGLYDIAYYFPLYPSTVLLLCTMYLCVRKARLRDLQKFIRPDVLSFIAFLFIGCIPSVSSPFFQIILLSVVQLTLLCGIYTLPQTLQLSEKMERYIAHIFSAFVIFQTIWVVLQVVNRGPLGRYLEATLSLNRQGILSSEDAGLMRYNGTFFEPSILGTFMLMHIFYFVRILINNKRLKNTERNIFYITVVAAFVAIVFTASRGIYLLLIALGIFWFHKQLYQLFVRGFSTLRFKIILIGIITVFIIAFPYISTRLRSASSLFGPLGSATFRLSLSSYALRVADVHPFGVGLSLSPYYFAYGFPAERTIDPAQPHNLLLQIVSEMGFPGLIVFVLFLWFIFRRYLIRPDNRSAPYFYASIVYIFASQFYPLFISQPEILSFFFLHAGLLTWTLQNQAT
jgi:O-antigen ligase